MQVRSANSVAFSRAGKMQIPGFAVGVALLGLMAGSMNIRAASAAEPSPAAAAFAAASNTDPLLFPKDQFTLKTMTVKTSTGEKKVVYRDYEHIPYVAKPVDKDYQSLNVKVPVSVDGVAVDASHAPILFATGVGGYMSFNNATGTIGGPGGMAGPPGSFPGMPAGAIPPPGAGGTPVSGQEDMALAAGLVVVEPGCRGRDNKAKDGTNYGKAPAAIVDLKAAVRYIRHNQGVLPGNDDWIVSTGCSAGGGLSSLLGASGNSPLYEPYLKEIGAAEGKDNVFATSCGSPVTDLDHADGATEWMVGTALYKNAQVDQKVSAQLKASFVSYQAGLNLKGHNNYGTLTADNYAPYLVKEYLAPSAGKYLRELDEEKRKEYLSKNPWIAWDGKNASFDFWKYVNARMATRIKGAPAFDDFEMTTPETILFGTKTVDARHFTEFSLRHATNNPKATLDPQLQTLVNMMNPMYFIGQHNPGVAPHWWIRFGGSEGLPETIPINLAASLENQGKDVNAWVYWDAGHCADQDPEGFVVWVGKITGYKSHK